MGSDLDYHDYLKSDRWDHKRKQRLKIAGYRCEICGAAESLQVHHLTYDRLGVEYMQDLQALCDSCHKYQHTHPNHWQIVIAAMLGLIVKGEN